MTRALVLSGGGVKGAYQVGVLRKWMCEDKIEYDTFSGVSVGALNASILAQVSHGKPHEAYRLMKDIWDVVDNSNIRRDWNFFGKIAALWKGHVYNTKPLQDWVKRDVHPEALKASGKQLLVGATCLDTGMYKVVREDTPDLWKWVYASAAFPLFFQEALLEGQLWVDGGARNVTPLGDVIRQGADEIDIIMTSNPNKIKHWNHKGKKIWQKAFRLLEILMSEITLNDIQTAGLKNDLARLGAGYKEVKIRLIYPEDQLVDDSLDFNPESIREMQEIGYSDALKADEFSLDLSKLP